MKTKVYILPGLGETCFEGNYPKLIKMFNSKGYNAIGINPNWYKPLSEQTFLIEPESILLGFSMGAVLAVLIAKKYRCKGLLLASMTPIQEFTYEGISKDILPYMSQEMADEIATDAIKNVFPVLKNLSLDTIPHTFFAGEFEDTEVKRLISVKNTGHSLNEEYIHTIEKTVENFKFSL